MSQEKSKKCFCSAMPELIGQDRRLSRRSRAVFIGDVKWETGETIKIGFIGGTNEQRAHVEQTANVWLKYANLAFQWNVAIEESDVRVSFVKGGGSWSFMGKQARGIDKNRATMNFGWLSDKPATNEVGTILHEFGHCLGLAHEHCSPNGNLTWKRDVVIQSLSGPPNNWSVPTIEANVFAKYKVGDSGLVASPFDQESIMLYSFPAEWTEEGIATKSNEKLSREDKLMMAKMYPKDGGVDVDDEPVITNKCGCIGVKKIVQQIAQKFKK